MRKVNNRNRYYCHRKTKTGRLIARQKTILLNHADVGSIDKYAARLRDVYQYNIQLTI